MQTRLESRASGEERISEAFRGQLQRSVKDIELPCAFIEDVAYGPGAEVQFA